MRKSFILVGSVAILLLLVMVGNVHGEGPPPPPPPPPFGGTPLPTPQPPCPPNGCATATPTVTPTPLPTATATPVPLTVSLQLAHRTVSPRSKQKITVMTLPGASVAITILFPNKDTKTHTSTAADSGKVTWSYTQPGSRITRTNRTARVTASVTYATSPTAKAGTQYTIGFAGLDVSAQPRQLKRGAPIAIWVHTARNRPLTIVLHFPGGTAVKLSGRTGSDGWSYTRYVVPKTVRTGPVTVLAQSPNGRRVIAGQTSFRVK